MKQIPNIITILNLFFGCCAIIFVLTAQPYFIQVGAEEQIMQIRGMEKLQWGSIFIGLAALMDMFDGWAARLLKVESNIGKDLDSLADVVSFGVAPATIMYQLLWRSYMMEPGALSTPFLALAPALLIACFAAYRLAKFNNSSADQKYYFIGMPTPSVGILIGLLPLILFFSYEELGKYLEIRAVLYAIIGIMCYFMISNHKFLKWSTGSGGFKGFWPQISILVVSIIGFLTLGWSGLILGYATYIICSLIYSYPVSK